MSSSVLVWLSRHERQETEKSALQVGVIACCVSILGCASLPIAPARLVSLRSSIERVAHAGALACAPRELALARAHYDFAQTELASGDATRAQHHLAVAEQNVGAAQVLTPDRGCAPGGDEVPAIPRSSARPRRAGGESAACAADGGSHQSTFPAGTVNTDTRCLIFSFAGHADTARALTGSQMSQLDRSRGSTDLCVLRVAIRLKPVRA